MRTVELVLCDIRKMVSTKGYVYALCMILFEDFHVNLLNVQNLNTRERLSTKEASLLLGFLIQNEIDFSFPDSPEELIRLKRQTYELLTELHSAIMSPFFEKLQYRINEEQARENFRQELKDFFGTGDILLESIFYSGTGVYDFQYLDFMSKKYKYDEEWLFKNKDLKLIDGENIVLQIKNILGEKAKKVNLYGTKERKNDIIEDLKRKNKKKKYDVEASVEEVLPMIEIYQFVKLFADYMKMENIKTEDDFREESWRSFYRGLVELFVIRKTDFISKDGLNSFLNNFSMRIESECNSRFQKIGNFNLINAKPIIQLDDERYFVPISYLVFESLYESPFYWMWDGDKPYRDTLGKNRGRVGEEIVFDFLSQVFGTENTYKSVMIRTKRGFDDTDIDTLCILGNKALCVQVKSKRLTELSRTGDDIQLQKDFQGAVQDAYNQGLISRMKILEKEAHFFDENGTEIYLSEQIDEVYIMGVTTENYPALAHQAHILLDKKESDPYPITLSVFDLELLVHYLKDPYEFLYYIRQRTMLMEYFKADEEMVYLGFHLKRKLCKDTKHDYVGIDNDYGLLIDRNYYPFKSNFKVPNDGDAIKNKWVDDNFIELCNHLKSIEQPKITDVIFYLLDWSEESRKDIVDFIIKKKKQTLVNGKTHMDSMLPMNNISPRIGITYISLKSDNFEELHKELFVLCELRKYKSKADAWIGFGSIRNSDKMFDMFLYDDAKWEYNQELEDTAKDRLGNDMERKISTIDNRKIGRNDKCPCGSGLKYKKCHGSNI